MAGERPSYFSLFMKNFLVFFILLFVSGGCLRCAGAIDTAGLRDEIMTEFAKHPEGVFAVAFKDISTGRQFLMNEHDNFHAASTMKTPVLIETFRQVAAHKFSLTDSITIHTNFTSIVDSSTYSLDSAVDSETDLYRRVGTKMTIRDLLLQGNYHPM
jgi:beta-lactamase class A